MLSGYIVWILTLAIISGQLIKLPVFSQGGISVLDITVIMLALAGMIKLKFKLKNPPHALLSLLIFIVTAALSLVLTPLPLQTSQYLTSFFYTLRLLSYLLLAWVIYSGAFVSVRQRTPIILIFSGTILAILGLLQFIFIPDLRFLVTQGWDPHYFRTVSTFLDPNFTGAFFVLTLLLLCHTSHLGGGNMMTRRVFYFIFAVVFIALLTTFSRSSYAMFLTGFISFAFFIKSWRLAFAAFLLFLLLFTGFSLYTKAVSAPRNIDRTKSASFRISTWQQGLILFQSHPVLGIGFNAYRFALQNYNLGDDQFLKSHGSSGNDSSLLFVSSTTGIIGLLIYLYFLFCLIRQRNLLSATALGLITHSFFANSLFYPPILIWLLLNLVTSKK